MYVYSVCGLWWLDYDGWFGGKKKVGVVVVDDVDVVDVELMRCEVIPKIPKYQNPPIPEKVTEEIKVQVWDSGNLGWVLCCSGCGALG